LLRKKRFDEDRKKEIKVGSVKLANKSPLGERVEAPKSRIGVITQAKPLHNFEQKRGSEMSQTSNPSRLGK
jgi:hypothetical protein